MSLRILWVVVAVPLTLIVIGGGAALSMPAVRHLISGWWNLPDRLPALAGNDQVHYEPGAENYARDVAALLSDAITRVEAVHGRPFARPAIVGVYTTMEAYAAANGLGSTVPVGVTTFGRVNLSPKLFSSQRQRVCAFLTHELSHAHIVGWIGQVAYLRLPSWFKEGLGVMVSSGGGAEPVSEDEARAAIQRGEQLVIDDAGNLSGRTSALSRLASLGGDVRLERAPLNKPTWYPVVLAYREAGMFVTYLRESDGPAFDRMMQAILDGSAFGEAVTVGYHDDVRSLWQKFVSSRPERK
jgi:hypothetical protein